VQSAVSADDVDERITTTTSSAGNDMRPVAATSLRQVAATIVAMDADGVTPNNAGVHV